jgi:hypothetical protein
MPWIEQLRVVYGRTIQPKQYESAKAEREMIITFAPGELKTDDVPMINRFYHDMGQVVKVATEEELGITASKSATPAAPPKDTPAKSAPVTPPASKPASPPKKDEKPAEPAKDVKPATPAKDDTPVAETVEGEPAYDRNKPRWNKCPRCGNTEIDAESEKENAKTGKKWVKKYQACFECGIFLNFDGKIVEMEGWEQREGKGAKA